MSIGERLKNERIRLGYSQEAFGEVGGVRKQAQLNYEKDGRSPDGEYFSAIAEIGADVGYIITSKREYELPEPLSRDEHELLELYRAAPILVRAAAVAALGTGGKHKNKEKYRGATIASVKQKGGSTVQQNFNGPVGRVVPGDLDAKESGKK